MGFRSYIRQFSGAILMLSVLHCHGDLLLGVVRFLASQPATGGSSSSRKQEEKVATIIFSMGFRRVAGAAAAGGNRRKK